MAPARIALQPFAADQIAEIASWLLSAKEASAWAGRDTPFPLTPDQFRRWHDDPDVYPFIACDDGNLIAYGEIWVDTMEQEIELARIIVHPSRRAMGIGRAFVVALVDRAASYGLTDVFMRVMPDNDPAIRCYQASGFERVSSGDEKTYNQGQPYDYVWLKYIL